MLAVFARTLSLSLHSSDRPALSTCAIMTQNVVKELEQQQLAEGFLLDTKGEKRWVQAFIKQYPETGTYVFINLHKKNRNNEFFQAQHIGLTMQEFQMLLNKSQVLENDIPQTPVVTPTRKRPASRLQPMAPKRAQRTLPRFAASKQQQQLPLRSKALVTSTTHTSMNGLANGGSTDDCEEDTIMDEEEFFESQVV